MSTTIWSEKIKGRPNWYVYFLQQNREQYYEGGEDTNKEETVSVETGREVWGDGAQESSVSGYQDRVPFLSLLHFSCQLSVAGRLLWISCKRQKTLHVGSLANWDSWISTSAQEEPSIEHALHSVTTVANPKSATKVESARQECHILEHGERITPGSS
jgi:hypothetical protein